MGQDCLVTKHLCSKFVQLFLKRCGGGGDGGGGGGGGYGGGVGDRGGDRGCGGSVLFVVHWWCRWW